MKKTTETVECGGKMHVSNNDTELVFIIDRSGSMGGFEADTIGGFNSMIENQKKSANGVVYVTTALFDNNSEILHDRVPINNVRPMTEEDYTVGGCTALLDAIGDEVHHITNIHKYARPDDVPKHTVFVITTDGMENASCKYSTRSIKDMIKRKTEKYGWEFIFVAANIDAIKTAGSIGIRKERAAGYRQTRGGFVDCYCAMSDFISAKRAGTMTDEDTCWKKRLEEE